MENKVKFKAGGEAVSIQFCPKAKNIQIQNDGLCAQMQILSTDHTIFRAGDVARSASNKNHKKAVLQTANAYVTPQNLSRGDLAWKIFDDISNLSEIYVQLAKLDSEHADTFSTLQNELLPVLSSMKKLAQTLSRTSRQPDARLPKISSISDGLSECLVLQKKILTDLRHLQRLAENFSTQIVVTYLTIQAQTETIQNLFDEEG